MLFAFVCQRAAHPSLPCPALQYRAWLEGAALHQLGNPCWDALFGRVMPQVGFAASAACCLAWPSLVTPCRWGGSCSPLRDAPGISGGIV